MAYWGGNMNYVGGAMSARAKIVAHAKRLVLASAEGKAMVNQALRELGTTPLGPTGKGKRGKQTNRTAAQKKATADLVALNKSRRLDRLMAPLD
jgi:hypothetical protein